MPLAQKLYYAVCYLKRSAALLQDGAHKCAKDYDKANAGKDFGEAAPY